MPGRPRGKKSGKRAYKKRNTLIAKTARNSNNVSGGYDTNIVKVSKLVDNVYSRTLPGAIGTITAGIGAVTPHHLVWRFQDINNFVGLANNFKDICLVAVGLKFRLMTGLEPAALYTAPVYDGTATPATVGGMKELSGCKEHLMNFDHKQIAYRLAPAKIMNIYTWDGNAANIDYTIVDKCTWLSTSGINTAATQHQGLHVLLDNTAGTVATSVQIEAKFYMKCRGSR